MRYFCKIRRISRVVESATLYVEADTEDKAQDLALDRESDTLEWDEDDSDTENLEVVICTPAV